MPSFDIVSLGSIYFDINAVHFPLENGLPIGAETVGSDYEAVPGGSAVNLAKVAASLGMHPAFIGKVGKDVFGEHLQKLLRDTNIEPAIITSASVQTNLGISFVGNRGESVMTALGSANQALEPSDVLAKLEEFLPQSRFLYLGGYFKLQKLIPHYPHIFELAAHNKTEIILDHGRMVNTATLEQIATLKSLIPQTQYYFPSEDEFLQIWGAPTVAEGLEKLRPTTSATIVVKQAEKGASASTPDQPLLHQAGLSITAVNTIGAGDSFNAGFMAAQIAGKNLADSLAYANATAAVMISQPGLPTPERVSALLSRAN